MSRPRLTITHETHAEVRSAGDVLDVVAIVRTSLAQPVGGVQESFKRAIVNRASRLAPGSRLYILRGQLQQGETLACVEYLYAMGSKETFEQARDWLVKAWGFVVDG